MAAGRGSLGEVPDVGVLIACQLGLPGGSRTAAILGVRASCPRGAHRAGGAELVKRGRVLCHPSGGGVGAGHDALGLGFQKGHAVRVQGTCARVRASGGG